MSVKVKFELPNQRKHHRVSAPIIVEMDGVAYASVDWSLSGLKLADYQGKCTLSDLVSLRVSVPFQGFHVGFSAQARVVRLEKETKHLALEFEGIGAREQELLRTFIDGLVRGEMQPFDGVIRRIDIPFTPISVETGVDLTEDKKKELETKRIRGAIIYTVAALILTSLFFILFRSNMLQMHVETAMMTAPVLTLRAPANADIAELLVSENSVVQQGTPLLRLTDPKLEREIESATQATKDGKTGVRIAQAAQEVLTEEGNLRLLQSAFARIDTLYAKGLASQQSTLDTKKKLDETARKLEEARRRLEDIRQYVATSDTALTSLVAARDRLLIRAPYDGRLLRFSAPEHASMREGSTLALFEQAGEKRVYAFLTHNESLNLSLGAEADVTFPSLGLRVPHRITDIDYLSLTVDQNEGTYRLGRDNDRTVTVRLAPIDAEAASRLEAVAPGTAAVVTF